MKTAFDLVCTNINSGSLTYIISLLQGIKKNPPKKKTYIFINKNIFDLHQDLIIKCKNLIIIKVPEFYTLSYFKIFWIQIVLPLQLKKLKVNKLLSPLNICPLVSKFFKIKTTLVLHSNLPWVKFNLMPGSFVKKKIIKYFMEKSLEKCDHIVCVSKSSKKELSKILKPNFRKKLKYLYLSLNDEFYKTNNNQFLKNIKYKQDYILSICSCAKYHNIIKLIQSFDMFLKKYDKNLNFYLVLTILDQAYFDEIKSYINKKNLQNKIKIILNMNPKFLFNLYKYAKAYIFSSYSETFGYTTLEAMKMNCPVAISNHSSSKEINGNASLYFNPNDVSDIFDKLQKIVLNKKIINKLKKRGKINIKKFYPGKHTKNLLKLIEN
jgi:glycosyltransferase involved in cell wall biosynthesis